MAKRELASVDGLDTSLGDSTKSNLLIKNKLGDTMGVYLGDNNDKLRG